LFYFVAGTLNQEANIYIMLVLAFKNKDTNINKADFDAFMSKFPVKQAGVYDLKSQVEGDKLAYALYQEITLR